MVTKVDRMALSSLQVRSISAICLAPVVLGLIYAGGVWFQAFTGFILVRALYEWVRMAGLSPRRLLLMPSGFAYIALTMGCVYLIRMTGDYGLYHFLGMVFTVWAADIGAYFTGKLIGGAKLAPRISPNKTMAGLFGSVFWGGGCLVLWSYFVATYLKADSSFDFSMIIAAVGCGMIVGFVGQFGDLLISAMKRHVKVKDTGQLIPGHGGILDRIDAMLLAAPVYLICSFYLGFI